MDKKVLSNSFWMMSEKIISIVGVFLVSSYVAKYVGPLIWGEIALAIVFFQIIQTVSQMGGDNILFRRISKKKHSGLNLMVSTTAIRLYIYIFFSTLLVFYFFSSGGLSVYIIAVSISFLFSSVDVLVIYYNAILLSKVNAFCNTVGLVISLLLRYVIAYLEMDPEYLALPIIISTFIPYIMRFFLFRYEKEKNIIIKKTKRNISRYSKYMIFSGASIVLSSISVAIYTRVNQIFLNNLDGTASVGIYSVAATIGTSWIFVSQAIITSFYTKIYAEKNDKLAESMIIKLNRVIFFISLCFVFIISFLGDYILNFLFGPAYSDAYQPMIILSIASLISSLGTISYRFIIRMSGFSFLSKKMILLMLISLPLSYLIVRSYGLIGAAYVTLLLELISLTVMNYFYKNKLILSIHLKTIFLKS